MSNRSSLTPFPSDDLVHQMERLKFCKYLLKENAENPHFINSILFIDEETFKINDKYLNLCACIIGDYIIGPFPLPKLLTGKTYKEFLESIFIKFENEMKLVRLVMLDDFGCSCNDPDDNDYYDNRTIINYLNSKFPKNCIFLPSFSPDLNPLKFYLWKHLKTLVYGINDDQKEESEKNLNFLERINNKFKEIQHSPGICQRVRDSMLRRATACINANGKNFDYFL